MTTNNHPSPNPLLLGAHLSIAGGFERALFSAQQIGATCVQIFTHSNRQWRMKNITELEIARFRDARVQTGVNHIVVHASYLINIASPNENTRMQSIKTLIEELKRCDELGIDYLVLHPGSSLTAPIEVGIANLAAGINEALETYASKATILLENMAGQGSAIGTKLEQLAQIRGNITHKQRVGFCFDTCHAFAAGYDFTTPEKYTAFWQRFDAILGLRNLKTIHINDSKTACGSNVDRHTHIGEGTLGLEAFRLLMNDPNFFAIPKIIETPKEDDLQEDIKNLNTLKGLLSIDRSLN
jgi:deoxyribonuclease-4